jgi:hypothetical protein
MRKSLVLLTLAAPAAAFMSPGACPLLSHASMRRMGMRLRGGSGGVAMSSLAQGKSKTMIKKKLGWSDLEVSAVCLGTMTFGCQNTEEVCMLYVLMHACEYVGMYVFMCLPMPPNH